MQTTGVDEGAIRCRDWRRVTQDYVRAPAFKGKILDRRQRMHRNSVLARGLAGLVPGLEA